MMKSYLFLIKNVNFKSVIEMLHVSYFNKVSMLMERLVLMKLYLDTLRICRLLSYA